MVWALTPESISSSFIVNPISYRVQTNRKIVEISKNMALSTTFPVLI
jgi:hypothetical protein